MGELTPVYEIDGRTIHNKSNSTIRERLSEAYKELTEKEGEPICLMRMSMKSFTAEIFIIGINPYVFVPDDILQYLFKKAGKEKGHIPVRLIINKQKFIQHLVKYAGEWRLYLNLPMRKAAGKDVGDIINIKIDFDATKRITPMHSKFESALNKNKKAKDRFNSLSPSLQKEILRYINNLKTEASVNRNIERAINFLLEKERFIGRDKPQ